jgi:hypothetical protein
VTIASQFREGTAIHDPLVDREVTLAVPKPIDRDHTTREMVGVGWLVETNEELVQIRTSYDLVQQKSYPPTRDSSPTTRDSSKRQLRLGADMNLFRQSGTIFRDWQRVALCLRFSR